MSSREQQLSELKQRVCCCIDESTAKLHSLSKDIWKCPELAYQEVKAHDRLVDFFRQEEGWEVDSHYKLHTAFRASWGCGGSQQQQAAVCLAFLCEYDALPGIGHACGHNLIAEAGVAAAVGLRAALQQSQMLPVPVQVDTPPTHTHIKQAVLGFDRVLDLCLQVIVLGTPAEEEGGGKVDMAREGAFQGLDVVFMVHPSKEDASYLPCVAEHEYVCYNT